MVNQSVYHVIAQKSSKLSRFLDFFFFFFFPFFLFFKKSIASTVASVASDLNQFNLAKCFPTCLSTAHIVHLKVFINNLQTKKELDVPSKTIFFCFLRFFFPTDFFGFVSTKKSSRKEFPIRLIVFFNVKTGRRKKGRGGTKFSRRPTFNQRFSNQIFVRRPSQRC